MFSAQREAALELDVEWEPKRLEFIEAWGFRDLKKKRKKHIRQGVLRKEQCIDWLNHTGEFTVPDQVKNNRDEPNGGLRLLMVDRTSLFPPGFAMSQDAFEATEKVLKLHPATLPSFLVQYGTHSRFLQRDENKKVTKIDIILKAPQKYEIANYGLSISFDVKTGWTTALIYGESVTETAWHALGRNLVSGETGTAKTWAYQSPADRIFGLLKSSSLPWNHPFLLPCAIVSDHLERMRFFCEKELTREIMEIERQLGIVRVGQRSEHGMSGLWPHFRPPLEDAEWTNALLDSPTIMNSMTVRINTQYTKVIFTKRSPSWSLETSQFLLNLWQNELKDFKHGKCGGSSSQSIQQQQQQQCIDDDHHVLQEYDDFLAETLEYCADIAKSMQGHVDNLQARMDLQLNILYSFVAQRDNRLNTRIARATGRDSVSMKILAFISALFLPATYIATLFSMQGLFNWAPQTSPSGDPEPIISPLFRWYWAISIPLTFITMAGWAWWWNVELKRLPAGDYDPPSLSIFPSSSLPRDDEDRKKLPGFRHRLARTIGLGSASQMEDVERRNHESSMRRRKSSGFVFDGRPRRKKGVKEEEEEEGEEGNRGGDAASRKEDVADGSVNKNGNVADHVVVVVDTAAATATNSTAATAGAGRCSADDVAEAETGGAIFASPVEMGPTSYHTTSRQSRQSPRTSGRP